MNECKTIRDVIELYLAQARRDLGDETYKNRARELRKFDVDVGHPVELTFRALGLDGERLG